MLINITTIVMEQQKTSEYSDEQNPTAHKLYTTRGILTLYCLGGRCIAYLNNQPIQDGEAMSTFPLEPGTSNSQQLFPDNGGPEGGHFFKITKRSQKSKSDS